MEDDLYRAIDTSDFVLSFFKALPDFCGPYKMKQS